MSHRLCWLLVCAPALTLYVQRICLAEVPPARVVVKVFEEATGEPVVGAVVYVNLGIAPSSEGPERHFTDATGRCEVAVPWGNVRLSMPMPPVGYWMSLKSRTPRQPADQFAVTREEPTVERAFTAQKGIVWPVKVATVGGVPAADGRLWVSSGATSHAGGGTVTDRAGAGQLTFPAGGGEVSIHCSFNQQAIALTTRRVRVHVDAGFDPTKVVRHAASEDGDWTELFDDQGRKVSISGCRIDVRDGAARLCLEVNDPPGPSLMGEIVGRVVDQDGRRIEGATVTCWSDSIRPDEYQRVTDEDGLFRFGSTFKWSRPGSLPGYSITASKDGYAKAEVAGIFVPSDEGVLRLAAPLVLQPGYNVGVRVLDEAGGPVEGAWVQTNAGQFQTARTNGDGYCELSDLPAGPAKITVAYGNRRGNASAEISPNSPSTSVEIRLRSAAESTASFRQLFLPPKLNRIVVGDPAPEWSIRHWLDGQERSLTDLRGRVVVLKFWSLGCKPCLEISVPVVAKIEPKFAKDVTFVHILSPDTEVQSLNDLLSLREWKLLVGVDEGTGSAIGNTMHAYGIVGFPTTIIIDRDGRVVDNGELAETTDGKLAALQALAKEAGLPWPVEEEASDEERIRRLQKLDEYWMTRRIEAALRTKDP